MENVRVNFVIDSEFNAATGKMEPVMKTNLTQNVYRKLDDIDEGLSLEDSLISAENRLSTAEEGLSSAGENIGTLTEDVNTHLSALNPHSITPALIGAATSEQMTAVQGSITQLETGKLGKTETAANSAKLNGKSDTAFASAEGLADVHLEAFAAKEMGDYLMLQHLQAQRDMNVYIQIANRVYPGVDLMPLYASEVYQSQYPTPWDWIQARARAADWYKLNVNDYIPLVLTDGYAFKMDISGMDTYFNYSDTPVPHHIDFISRDCHPVPMVWNKADYNNGTSVSPHPWLASELYARLNSKKMFVPNSATANPELVEVDYTTTGVWDKLPAALQNVIVEKRIMLPKRYTAGALLTDDNGWDLANIGKLWLPSEMEVYGTNMWGSLVPANPGHSMSGFQQYPIFSGNMKRIKGAGDGGVRTNWWVLSARGGLSTHCARAEGSGFASNHYASNTNVRVPLCFRIA